MLRECLQVCPTCPKNLFGGDCGYRNEGLNHVKQIEIKVMDVGMMA